MPQYNRIPIAFTRSYNDMYPKTGYEEDTGEFPYKFIVTGFDMSSQANAQVYIIGDEYKVASYGTRMSVKKVSGYIPNPVANIEDILTFYRYMSIGYNFAGSISVIYKNYTGYGQIVGMDITIGESGPGMISLHFLEESVSWSLPISIDGNTQPPDVDEYKNMINTKREFLEDGEKRDNPWKIQMYIAEDGGISKLRSFNIDTMSMSVSSRYGLIDVNKNLIYYGENPVQFALGITIQNNDNMFREWLNDISLGSRITSDGMLATFHMGNRDFPIAIMSVSGSDVGDQQNYMKVNFVAIANGDDVGIIAQ